MKSKRPTVADLRALKGKRQLKMLFVETPDEAAAACAAGIDVLSIIDPIWTPEMREAAGSCFVQIGLLYGDLCTYEDYLRAAHRAIKIGGDAVYCAASRAFRRIAGLARSSGDSNARRSISNSERRMSLATALPSPMPLAAIRRLSVARWNRSNEPSSVSRLTWVTPSLGRPAI